MIGVTDSGVPRSGCARPVGRPLAVLDARAPEAWARVPSWSLLQAGSRSHQTLLLRETHSFKIVANMGNLFKQH